MTRFLDFFIQFWIIVSIVCFTVETIPDLSANTRSILEIFEWISVSIFTCEYLIRAIYSKPIRKYCLSFFGIIDLLSILPFYVGLAIDLRSIRVIRLLRLLRLFKFARYTKAIDRLKKSFIDIKSELVVFGFITLIVIYLSAVGIYHFEHEKQPENFGSVVDSLWWAVATLTTVGYGDVYPKTAGGKLFTSMMLFIGLGIVSIPSGLIASSLTKNRDD